jgi:hypothetical protein
MDARTRQRLILCASAIDIIARGHVKTIALQLASFLLLVASTAFCQNTKLGNSCDLSILGAKDTKSFLAFDKELRTAITKQDAAAMAFVVEFPLRINSATGEYSLNDPAALQSHFQEVFPAAVRKAILDQKVEEMFCKDEGVMYGNGEVWVDATKLGYAIQIVNLRSAVHSPVANERQIDFVCQTEKFRIVVDSVARTSRYRAWNRPHPVTGEPDLEINTGERTMEGTGPCAHPVWTFKNSRATYIIRGLGCTEDEPPKGAKGMFDVQIQGQSKASGWCY